MATEDFFRARLETMIDMRHALAVLVTRMPGEQIEASLAPLFSHKERAGQLVEGADLFGPTLEIAGAGVSQRGRPRLPIRLVVALLYLKHAYGESDESVVERWAQDVYWATAGFMDTLLTCKLRGRRSFIHMRPQLRLRASLA